LINFTGALPSLALQNLPARFMEDFQNGLSKLAASQNTIPGEKHEVYLSSILDIRDS